VDSLGYSLLLAILIPGVLYEHQDHHVGGMIRMNMIASSFVIVPLRFAMVIMY
jgi:hypothetical protein